MTPPPASSASEQVRPLVLPYKAPTEDGMPEACSTALATHVAFRPACTWMHTRCIAGPRQPIASHVGSCVQGHVKCMHGMVRMQSSAHCSKLSGLCRDTLRPSGGISGGSCEPPLLPVWGHSERGIPHGEQQPAEPHPDEQADSPAGGEAGPGPAPLREPPLWPAEHQGQGRHAHLLAAHPPCELNPPPPTLPPAHP